jgi:hypothetical protein
LPTVSRKLGDHNLRPVARQGVKWEVEQALWVRPEQGREAWAQGQAAWGHRGLAQAAWAHQGPARAAWGHRGLVQAAWAHLGLARVAWAHLEQGQAVWAHQGLVHPEGWVQQVEEPEQDGRLAVVVAETAGLKDVGACLSITNNF